MRHADRYLSALILAAFLGPVSARAGQLIQDKSFELGPSNPYWTCSQTVQYTCATYNACDEGPTGLAIISTQTPRTGAFAAHLASDHDPFIPGSCKYHRSRLSQVFAIPSNVITATLKLWVTGDGSHKLHVELYDAVSGVKYTTFAVLSGTFPYTQFTFTGLETWKGKQVLLHFRTAPIADDDASDWFIDDVTVNTTT